jgi:hypothetical protein
MTYTKVEEQRGEYLLVYFTDSASQKQGDLFCYKTEGKFASAENLLFIEEYKDDLLLDKKWMKLPQIELV